MILVSLVAFALAAAAAVQAQPVTQKQSGAMRFEVASVRPNPSGPGSASMRRLPDGSFSATNVTPRDLILYTYGFQWYRVLGAPGWISNERFDVIARAGSEPPAQTPADASAVLIRLRALLAERFGLAVHVETREMPIYALVLARPDGQLGPQLRRSLVNCDAQTPGAAAAGASGAQPACGGRGGIGFISRVGPMSAFPDGLAGHVQRTVVDRTGLTGVWEVNLTWTPDGLVGRDAAPSPQESSGGSLFTALQEQLGLRLEPSRASLEVLIIDRIQRPTAN